MATQKRMIVKTGIDNNGNSIINAGTIGSSLQVAGANSVTLTSTGTTNVTLPTSGLLLSTTSTGAPNSLLANSSLTIGTTTINLGGTTTTIGGLSAVAATTFTGALSGNASTASALQTGRTISATGDGTWSVLFDGTATATSAFTLATVNSAPVTASFAKVTVNGKGLVTATSNVGSADITGVLGYTPLSSTGGTLTGALSMNNNLITNLATPVAGTDAATKNYVDSATTGLTWKTAVRAATTASIVLSGTQTVDSVALVAGDRVLAKDQTDATTNGIYVVAAGAWSRATDADSAAELDGSAVFVREGSNANTGWVCSSNPANVGSASINYSQFTGSGTFTAGTGLSLNGNTFSNTGVLSVTGTTNQIAVSGSTGNVTLSLPPSITISGTATANAFVGSLTGNASSATALQTARTINGVAFDGTANITVAAAAGTLTGTTLASNVVSSSLTSVGTLGTLAVSGGATVGSLTTASAAISGGTIDGTVIGGATPAAGTFTTISTANSASTSNSTVVTGTAATTIDSFSILTYRSAKYVAQISDGTSYETAEFLVIHDGTNVFITVYGNVFTSAASLGDFDATISGNTLNVTYTAVASTNKTVKVTRDAIKV
jgi:hypothetical protein